ncbi:MAG: hypothetical protein ACKVZ0_07875 [Gemmatimonadales bacterium]
MRTTDRLALATGLAAALVATACDNSGVDRGFPPEETGTVLVGVYLDRDGSRTFNLPIDTLYSNARIALLQRGTSDTLLTATSGVNGAAVFRSVPLGEYRLAVAPASIGDSLVVGSIDTSASIRLQTAPDTIGIDVRLTFPEVSIRQARNLPLGKRIFLRSIVLAGVQSFRDTTSHVVDSSSAIRLTRVTLRGGLIGNNPGDSVSVIGVVSTRAGQPTLDQAVLTRFATRPPPVPVQASTGTAATAAAGALDANLVQITGAIISDTATIAPDFRVVVSDQSGDLVILLDGNLNFVRSNFRPGRTVNARGVLVPDGSGAWMLKPREVNDAIAF